MCSKLHIALLIFYIPNVALSKLFESEEIVPVRIRWRNGSRFWKRSDEQPTFKLVAFGKDFTLNLTPDDSFLAPTIKIQRIKAKYLSSLLDSTDTPERKAPFPKSERDPFRHINTTEEAEEDLRGCFYSGTVDSNEDSVVAVSLCYGIQGSFITEGDEYLIEPKVFGIKKSEKSTSQLHVIKRRVFADTKRDNKTTFDQVVDGSHGEQEMTIVPEADGVTSRMMRKKRFVSAPRYVETLVVADASMTQFYGDEIKHYVLTLMSVAAQIYRHPSIKNSINMVVVKMLVVEDEEMGPSVSSNGGVTLRNFCSWQQLFNPPSQRHPEHYDTAVFFTRQDICGHQSCDTLGVADVGTMCDPKRSCSVIEDNGLQAAFTAAHELGHVLSMPHDDSKNCEQLFGALGEHHMMAPLFVQLNTTLPWSPCSALYVTQFFDNGHGDCLLDAPEKILPLPTELPGLTYNLDRQCQQIFGEEFAHCPNTSDSDICSQLWCREEGQPHCTTKNGSLPWADGTACGNNHTCLNGACLASKEVMQPKVVVDGS